jgi:hypothetical protein
VATAMKVSLGQSVREPGKGDVWRIDGTLPDGHGWHLVRDVPPWHVEAWRWIGMTDELFQEQGWRRVVRRRWPSKAKRERRHARLVRAADRRWERWRHQIQERYEKTKRRVTVRINLCWAPKPPKPLAGKAR